MKLGKWHHQVIFLICSRQNIPNLPVERKNISLSLNALTCQCLALSSRLEAKCHFVFFPMFSQSVVTSMPVLPAETSGNQSSAALHIHNVSWHRMREVTGSTPFPLVCTGMQSEQKSKTNGKPLANKSVWTHMEQGCSSISSNNFCRILWEAALSQKAMGGYVWGTGNLFLISSLSPCCSSNCCGMSGSLSKAASGEVTQMIHPPIGTPLVCSPSSLIAKKHASNSDTLVGLGCEVLAAGNNGELYFPL